MLLSILLFQNYVDEIVLLNLHRNQYINLHFFYYVVRKRNTL